MRYENNQARFESTVRDRSLRSSPFITGIRADSVAVEAAIRYSENSQRGIGKDDLRRRLARYLFLLEAGAVSATGGVYSSSAQTVWHRRATRNRLSPVAVLFTRVGGSRWPGCLRLGSLSTTTDAAACCLKEKEDVVEYTQYTSSSFALGWPLG